jgi:hypothetical protein
MIMFENDGIIPLEAFTTFGINVKVNENPIGYFGTGLKYAVAITLRLGGTFQLWRDGVEYEFYVKKEDFRGKEFGTIRMKKRRGLTSRWTYERLPFTTELGKDWEPWMAFRELESNTRDENGRTHILDPQDLELADLYGESKTLIAVTCPEIERVFTDELDTVFMSTSVLKSDHLIDKPFVDIYDRPSKYLFYRGLRVVELPRPSLFTYNLKQADLTEDRTLKYYYSVKGRLSQTILTADSSVARRIINAAPDTVWEQVLDYDYPFTDGDYSSILDMLMSMKGQGLTIPSRFSAFYDMHRPKDPELEMVEITKTMSEWRRLASLLPEGERMKILQYISTEVEEIF